MKNRGIRSKQLIVVLSIAAMVMTSGCSAKVERNQSQTEPASEAGVTQEDKISDSMASGNQQNAGIDLSAYEIEYTDRDLNTDWQSEKYTSIAGTGSLVEMQGEGITEADEVLTIQEEGTYVFSGDFDNYAIVVDAPESKIRIVLNGMQISNSKSAPITVVESKKVVVTLADGTTNTVADCRTEDVDTEEESTEELIANAAIYSQENMTFQGKGALRVVSDQNNGITCKDELIFMDGSYSIETKGHGINGKDFLIIHEGEYSIVSGKDGLRSTKTQEEGKGFVKIEGGQITIDAGQDGIQAETLAYVADGILNINTNGGSQNAEAHTTENFGFGGGRGMGGFDENRPDKSQDMKGERPQMSQGTEGERPQLPQGMEGEAPQLPQGMEGEAPQLPQGMEGEAPQMPQDMEGKMPEMTENDAQTDSSTSEETVSCKGIKAGNMVYIESGTFVFDTSDDAIHSNGDVYVMCPTMTIQTGDDGIHADNLLEIYQGSIDIQKSYEGLEGTNLTIYDGNISIVASDDGINVAGGDGSGFGTWMQDSFTDSEHSLLTIAGGTIYVDASGDGLDSNGGILQTGGNVIVDGPSDGGNGALDYDSSYLMNGGTLLAVGSLQMLQTASDESVCYGVTAYYNQNMQSGTKITVSINGTEQISHVTTRGANAVQYISADISENDEVTIQAGDDSKTVQVSAINVQMKSDGSVTTGAVSDSIGFGGNKKR